MCGHRHRSVKMKYIQGMVDIPSVISHLHCIYFILYLSFPIYAVYAGDMVMWILKVDNIIETKNTTADVNVDSLNHILQ